MRITSIVVPLLVALSSSGCLQYVLVMGNPSQKAAAYQRTIDGAVGDAREKKDCPRWIAGLNSIKEKLPIVDSGGKNATWYGDAIRNAYHQCTLEAVEDLKAGKGSGLERGKRAVERFDLVLSLPLEKLKLEDQDLRGYAKVEVRPGVASLKQLRADTVAHVERLERAHAEKVAREAKRLEAAKAAEAKGFTLAALTAWTALDPMDDATAKEKAAAVARLAGPAKQLVAVTVALAPATTEAAPEAVLAQVRSASALGAKPTLKLVEPGAPATVQVQLSLGAIKKESARQKVSFQHSYVSGSTMVPNPDLEKLKKDIAYNDKEAAWHDEKSRNACSGNRDKRGCTSIVTHANSAKSHREKAARARQDLAKAKPMVRRDVTSVYEYTGEKTVYSATAPLAALLSAPGSQAPSKLTGTAKVEKSTTVYPGNQKVGLAPRTDAAPTPADLDAELMKEAARLLVNGIVTAPSLAAGEFDQKAAAATEPLEQLHYAVLRALRSGAGADQQKADALAKTLLESTTNTPVLVRTLARATASAGAMAAEVPADAAPVTEAAAGATPATAPAATSAAAPATEAAPAPAAAGTAEGAPAAAP